MAYSSPESSDTQACSTRAARRRRRVRRRKLRHAIPNHDAIPSQGATGRASRAPTQPPARVTEPARSAPLPPCHLTKPVSILSRLPPCVSYEPITSKLGCRCYGGHNQMLQIATTASHWPVYYVQLPGSISPGPASSSFRDHEKVYHPTGKLRIRHDVRRT